MPNESCQVLDGDAYFDALQQDRAAVDFDQWLDTLKPLPEEIQSEAACSMPSANEQHPSFASAIMPAEAQQWAEFASSSAQGDVLAMSDDDRLLL